MRAHFVAGGESECCDTLRFRDDGTAALNCRHGSQAILWLPLLAGVVCVTLVVLVSRGGCKSRRGKYANVRSNSPDEVVGTSTAVAQASEAAGGISADGAVKAERADEELAKTLLEHMSGPRHQARAALVKQLVLCCGFQEDSGRNQAEHFESLLLSYLSTNDGDYAAAVNALYRDLLGSYERWLLHMSGQLVGQSFTFGAMHYEWERPDTSQQEKSIALWLLVWGEAGNLRFMPELLNFIFALAHAHCSKTLSASVSPSSVAVRPYLETLVRPIYACVLGETCSGLAPNGRPKPRPANEMSVHPRNYDDWNQLFWSPQALSQMRTSTGALIMAASPEARWELLLDCDWRAFLSTGCPKFFKEERWWLSMLAANRRLYLLHAVAFGLVAFNPYSRPGAWKAYFNGWGTSFLLTFFLLAAPLSSALGACFEYWSTQEERMRLLHSKLLVATLAEASPLIAAATGIVCLQLTHTPEEVTHEDLTSPSLVLLLSCGLILIAGGGRWFYREMKPQRGAMGGHEHVVFDSNLQWEARVSSLAWRSWFVDGDADADAVLKGGQPRRSRSWLPRPRPEVVSVVKMYGFWALVWGAKLTLAWLVLIPMLFDGHALIDDAYKQSATTASSQSERAAWDWEPSQMLKLWLLVMIWVLAAAAFVADTLYWYSIILGVVGGFRGLAIHGY